MKASHYYFECQDLALFLLFLFRRMKEGRPIFRLHTYTYYFKKYYTYVTPISILITFKLIETERYDYTTVICRLDRPIDIIDLPTN